MTMDGTVERDSGQSTMRFERNLAHPIKKVWAALTETDRLAEWLAPGEIELVPGGRVSIVFTNTDAVEEGEKVAIESTVTEIDPPRVLEFRWLDASGDSGPVRWELSEIDGGTGTRLLLTHAYPGSDEGVIENRAGWETHLSMLVDALAGRPRTFDWDHHNALVARYRAELRAPEEEKR